MINAWVFNCRKVAERVSRSMDEKLPLSQRMGIRMHISMCRLCARHRRQLLHLRRVFRYHLGNDPAFHLSEEVKKKMIAKIRRTRGA